MIKKKRKTLTKKRKRKPREKKPQMIVVTQQPTEIIQRTMLPEGKHKKVWDAVDDIRKTMFCCFWIAVGLAPIAAHIGSQFYCGVEGARRCNLIEFPAWMEAGGIFIALIAANAMRDIISKSTVQLLDSMKGLPKLLRGKNGNTAEIKAAEQDK